MESRDKQATDETDLEEGDTTTDSSSEQASDDEPSDAPMSETAADAAPAPEGPQDAKEKGRWQQLRHWSAGVRMRTVVTTCVILLLVLGSGGYFWLRAETLPDGVALRVNDRDITVEQVNDKIRTMKAMYGVQEPQDPGGKDKFRRTVAKSYSLQLVLEKAARDEHAVVPDKAARDVLDRYIAQQAGEGEQARSKFVEALGHAGTSERAVVGEIKRMLEVNHLFERTTKGIAVTDDDVHRAFQTRQGTLGTPETRDLRNIVVRTREDADGALSRLRNGEHFETVAAEMSLDGQTKNNGGNLGTLSGSQLEDGYAKAAFQTPQGALFGPVQTQHGWNVGQVTGVHPPAPAAFEQVHDRLKQQLTYEKTMDRWQKWIGDHLRAANIRYADTYRPADPDSPPSASPGQPAPGNPQQPSAPR